MCVIVRIGAKLLRLRRFSVNQETCGEAAGGSREGHGRALEVQDADVGGPRACAALTGGRIAGRKTELVVCGGAERVVAGLEPFEAGEREPAIGPQKFRDMLFAPGQQVALPRVLREARQAEKRAEKSNCEHLGGPLSKPRSFSENTVGSHRDNYIASPPWPAPTGSGKSRAHKTCTVVSEPHLPISESDDFGNTLVVGD